MMYGGGGFVILLVWLVGLAILFGIIYFAVRLAVLSSLKAHTQWLRSQGAPQAPPPSQAPPSPPSA